MNSCPVCGSGAVAEISVNLSFCKTCSHMFQADQKVVISYDPAYAHNYDSQPHQKMSDIRLGVLKKTELADDLNVLDIGYGNGSFVKTITRAGYAGYGTDVHGEDFGISEVVLSEIHPDQFDCVTFFDSLEHFNDLKLVQHMRPQFVIVSIPNRHDHLMFEPESWRHYKPGEHLHYFSQHSLSVFMKRWAGYELQYAGYDEDALRGKLVVGGIAHNNIYTAIYKIHD